MPAAIVAPGSIKATLEVSEWVLCNRGTG